MTYEMDLTARQLLKLAMRCQGNTCDDDNGERFVLVG